jgi:FkbM family methyltransferase
MEDYPPMARMKRPWLLRVLPDRLSIAVWSRFYRGKHAGRHQLYEAAQLRYAPAVEMSLIPGDIISDTIAFTGVYEPLLTRRVATLSRQGGTMIEIGANLGYFSLLWAAGHPKNICIAFEASPRNIELLRKNAARNACEAQIQVFPCAAGSAPGKGTFDVGPQDQTGWGGFATAASRNAIEVDIVRVDDHVAGDTPINLLKVDIEGADTWALIGCDRLLKNRVVREIWYEQNKPRMRALGVHLEEAQDYLRSVGYTPTPQTDPTRDLVEWAAVLA